MGKVGYGVAPELRIDGAGKTTIINTLTTLIKADGGTRESALQGFVRILLQYPCGYRFQPLMVADRVAESYSRPLGWSTLTRFPCKYACSKRRVHGVTSALQGRNWGRIDIARAEPGY